MALSRLEVNLRRLLVKCELLVKSSKMDEHKFPKYVETLENMLEELSNLPENSMNMSLITYRKRIRMLKSHYGLNDDLSMNKESQHKSFKQDDILTMREQLLGIRERNVWKAAGTEGTDEVINYHRNLQDKIAGDMLMITRTLKEQSKLANKIIKKDTEIVSKSAQLTDQNFSKLKVESTRLAEHSKRAWKCWMWIMLFIVMVVFINMVLFMKITKKKY